MYSHELNSMLSLVSMIDHVPLMAGHVVETISGQLCSQPEEPVEHSNNKILKYFVLSCSIV